MPQTFRFAQMPTPAATTPQVDQENAILRGVTAMQAGVEAIGHGCMADRKTLQMMVDLSKQKPQAQIRQRFGHPGVSENITGKQVSIARNFRVNGDNLVHDSYLLESARLSPAFAQDPIAYILNIAQNAPTEFGESVVIEANTVWVLPGGVELDCCDDDNWPPGVAVDAETGVPVNAINPLPTLRPTEFYYCDFVNEGALTHEGMFPGMNDGEEGDMSASRRLFASGPSAYAEELFILADQFRNQYNIPLERLPDKLNQLLAAYTASRRKDSSMKQRKPAALAAKPSPAVVAFEADELATVADLEESYEAGTDATEGEDQADTQPQPSAEFGADPIALAESMASEMQVSAFAQPKESGEVLALADMREAMASMSDTVERLSAKVERTSALLVQAFEIMQTMQRNLQRIEGEPVVTQKVPSQKPAGLEALPMPAQYSQPKPTGMTFAAKPTHVSQRQPDGTPNRAATVENDDPAAAMIRRKQALAQAARMANGQAGG